MGNLTGIKQKERIMIIRVFRAVVQDGMQNEFKQFFLNQAVPHVRSQAGLVELSVGLPIPSTPDEFLMIMFWKDLESVKGFAGSDWEKAVILEAERHLIKEVHVHHYESANLGE